jgi:hypothetical protein
MATESEAYQIETFDATNNKTERRTITPLPQPAQRFQKPETPTLPELRQAVNDLISDIEGAGADYETVAADLDSFYAPHKALEKRISELRAALSQAEHELSRTACGRQSGGGLQTIYYRSRDKGLRYRTATDR